MKNGPRGTIAVDPHSGTKMPISVLMHLPCRKCDNCLKSRRNLWSDRARVELSESQRSWFGTLTLRPDEHDRVRDMCRLAAAKCGDDFDALSYKDQFVARHRYICRYVTLFLKRVRKNSNASLRYLFVAEQHKNYLPHYHFLLHEQFGSDPCSWRVLEAAWPHGFSQFKIVEEKHASTYVTKYLAKSGAARVRASLHYGRRSLTQPSTLDVRAPLCKTQRLTQTPTEKATTVGKD